MIKIRLARCGSIHRPRYSIVVANDKSPRDGRFICKVGHYNPFNKDFALKKDKVDYYMSLGAQMTSRVHYLYKLYNKNIAQETLDKEPKL